MDHFLYLFASMALFLFATALLLRANKAIRSKRGALSQKINLDDLKVLSLASLFYGALLVLQDPVLNLVAMACFGLYGLLVWLDAILFVQYRIEINRQTIAWFFTGSKGLGKGLPHLLALFKQYPIAVLIPLLWGALSYAGFSMSEPVLLLKVVLASLLLCIVCVYFFQAGIAATLASTACFAALLTYPFEEVSVALIWALAAVYLISIVAIMALLVLRKLFHSQHEFLTSPTLLTNILADDNFAANENIAIKQEHINYVAPKIEEQIKSPYYGQCAGANVILITVESLGAYINPYIADGARSRIAEKLADKSWLSKQHFCLCPNTTVSTNQMYTGAYSNNPYNKLDSLFPGSEPLHLQALKAQGYKTLFLDSANTDLFDYHRLLKRIGFDRVWGTADIPELGLQADYRLWNMVDVIAEEVQGSPFFLHVINDQTHMPYQVVDNKRFSNHKGTSQKSLYLNALEEVDYILDVFLERLADKIDLSNTILVFTGDHGESFGEFGYSFHSNSVILPQMQVPFMLSHPKLEAKTLAHSCHFDLFPTFFDLLGLEYAHSTIGQSLGLSEREFSYFFHSATLKGNSPANFGLIKDGELCWVDRLFNQVSVLNADHIRQSTSKQQEEYIKTFLYHMLEERHILVTQD